MSWIQTSSFGEVCRKQSFCPSRHSCKRSGGRSTACRKQCPQFYQRFCRRLHPLRAELKRFRLQLFLDGARQQLCSSFRNVQLGCKGYELGEVLWGKACGIICSSASKCHCKLFGKLCGCQPLQRPASVCQVLGIEHSELPCCCLEQVAG